MCKITSNGGNGKINVNEIDLLAIRNLCYYSLPQLHRSILLYALPY